MCSLATKINPPSYFFHRFIRWALQRAAHQNQGLWRWWRQAFLDPGEFNRTQLPRIDLETGYRIQNGFAWIYWVMFLLNWESKMVLWMICQLNMGLEHGISANLVWFQRVDQPHKETSPRKACPTESKTTWIKLKWYRMCLWTLLIVFVIFSYGGFRSHGDPWRSIGWIAMAF